MTRLMKMIVVLGVTLGLGVPKLASAEAALLLVVNAATGAEVALSEAEMMALPQATVNTENEFVDTMTTFQGPLGRDVLALVGEGGDTVALTAVNDYTIEVPLADFLNYNVVFAMTADGTQLSRRDKGPIWVIYPMSEHSELRDPMFNARLLWQLVKVELK